MSPAGGPKTDQQHLVEHVTCLGCGCACDDIGVRVTDGRITDALNACALGRSWFGDGQIADQIRIEHAPAELNPAVDAIATLLTRAATPLVYLAPELSCEAQREAVALADLLRASLDTVSSSTVLASVLAAQERGRASATLGEIRNRADVLVFWGVDPNERYPRYWSRYAPEPVGLHVHSRRARRVIAVDVGGSRGPADADVRVTVDAADEVPLLTAATAVIGGAKFTFEGPLGEAAGSLAAQLSAARYSVVVADTEPLDGPQSPARDPQRARALIALTQALNGPSRSALSSLRAGGNRSGADAVLTSHTGYPLGIDFATGFPVYRPHDRHASANAALILGDASKVPPEILSRLTRLPLAIVGPGASRHQAARVAVDTGVAGIHCGGTALRLDDIPLPLRPSLTGRRDPADVIRLVTSRSTAALVGPGATPGARR